MAHKGIAALETFMAGVIARLPEADRVKAQERMQALREIEPLAGALGDGILGQSEVSRQLDELREKTEQAEAQRTAAEEAKAAAEAHYASLNGWYTANRTLLEEAKTLKQNGHPNPNLAPNPAPQAGLTAEQLNERIQQEQAGVLGFMRDQSRLNAEHFAKFKEPLELEPLIGHPEVGKVGLVGVYSLVHKARLEKYAADTAAAAEQKIRADERAKLLAEQAQMPYPSPTGIGSGSPLDALAPAAGSDALVATAVAEYQRLQQERSARP